MSAYNKTLIVQTLYKNKWRDSFKFDLDSGDKLSTQDTLDIKQMLKNKYVRVICRLTTTEDIKWISIS
jgi:hypothetical protein